MKGKFYSEVLKSERNYQVLLPTGYIEGNDRFPVIYLLHGKDQNFLSWTNYTFLEVIAKQYPSIIAIPNGDNEWFLEYKSGYEAHQLYIKEFISYIDEKFRSIPNKENRGICGISMGGYAAFLTAFNSPDLFSSVSALSGVLNITNHFDNNILNTGMPTDKAAWIDYDLLVLAEKIKDKKLDILFDSGLDDYISILDCQEFSKVLQDLSIPHIFNNYSGGHDWYYWDQHLEEHIEFHNKSFSKI